MAQKGLQEEKRTEKMNIVSQALASIYTGVFSINLVNDTYDIISLPPFIISMLDGITSAQKAINCAIQNTVSRDELLDVLSFVNLFHLPKRMESEKCLNIDYRGTISGWVRGSFIEAERDSMGKLTQVLYVYQIIDEEKRKELEHIQRDITHITALEKEKNVLQGKNTLLANENVELQRARDAVYSTLKAGSYLCTYAEDGESLLSIKFSDALRELYGYSDEKDAPNNWDMWLKGSHPEDREYVDAGANITKAMDGQQAVDVFAENKPGTFDMILMDVMMPVMDGYEATRCIRSLEREDAKEIPIIAMTANAFVEDVEKARQAGMNGHLAKPIKVDEMLKLIGSML